MKTYIIYTAEGKTVAAVKGTRIVSGDKSIIIQQGDITVAVIPFEGRFAVVEST